MIGQAVGLSGLKHPMPCWAARLSELQVLLEQIRAGLSVPDGDDLSCLLARLPAPGL